LRVGWTTRRRRSGGPLRTGGGHGTYSRRRRSMSTETPVGPPIETTTAAQGPPGPGPGGLPLLIDGRWHVPPGIVDAESFRRWTLSEEFPSELQASWRDGTLWLQTPGGGSLCRLNPPAAIAPVPRTGAAVVLDAEVWVPGSVVDLPS